MTYVLDTDILTLLAHGDSPEAPRIARRIAQLPSEHSVVTTIVNYEEQMRGWLAALSRAKSSKSEVAVYGRLLKHLITFRQMTVLGFEDHAGKILAQLKTQRLSIGTMDLKIASIVLAHSAVLVSRNAKDFSRIPMLRLEDWTVTSY